MVVNSLSIGQLSALTGIKTITLRAWETRYGLLIPSRKKSGHRIYSQSDVDKIREIRFWLNQGISISKVESYLKNIHTHCPNDDRALLKSISQLQQSAIQFDQANLKHHIDTIFSLYPIDFFIERILPKIIQTIGQAHPVSLRFFKSLFRHKLREFILSSQHPRNAKKLLITRSQKPYSRLNVLGLASILSVYDYHTTVIEHPLYIEHIPTILQQGMFDGFVLFTDTTQVAIKQVKQITDMPWLKIIVSQKPHLFDTLKGITTSQDTLNGILETLKSNIG